MPRQKSADTPCDTACASAPRSISVPPSPDLVKQQLLDAAHEALACGRLGLSEMATQMLVDAIAAAEREQRAPPPVPPKVSCERLLESERRAARARGGWLDVDAWVESLPNVPGSRVHR